MDADVIVVDADERGRLTGAVAARARSTRSADADGLFAVVATAGTTNAGLVDDLDGVADVCRRARALVARRRRLRRRGAGGADAPAHRFAGIERADCFVVDPHKWLFAPFDCGALLYRDPAVARAAHTQHAAYLDGSTAARSGTRPTTPST